MSFNVEQFDVKQKKMNKRIFIFGIVTLLLSSIFLTLSLVFQTEEKSLIDVENIKLVNLTSELLYSYVDNATDSIFILSGSVFPINGTLKAAVEKAIKDGKKVEIFSAIDKEIDGYKFKNLSSDFWSVYPDAINSEFLIFDNKQVVLPGVAFPFYENLPAIVLEGAQPIVKDLMSFIQYGKNPIQKGTWPTNYLVHYNLENPHIYKESAQLSFTMLTGANIPPVRDTMADVIPKIFQSEENEAYLLAPRFMQEYKNQAFFEFQNEMIKYSAKLSSTKTDKSVRILSSLFSNSTSAKESLRWLGTVTASRNSNVRVTENNLLPSYMVIGNTIIWSSFSFSDVTFGKTYGIFLVIRNLPELKEKLVDYFFQNYNATTKTLADIPEFTEMINNP